MSACVRWHTNPINGSGEEICRYHERDAGEHIKLKSWSWGARTTSRPSTSLECSIIRVSRRSNCRNRVRIAGTSSSPLTLHPVGGKHASMPMEGLQPRMTEHSSGIRISSEIGALISEGNISVLVSLKWDTYSESQYLPTPSTTWSKVQG